MATELSGDWELDGGVARQSATSGGRVVYVDEDTGCLRVDDREGHCLVQGVPPAAVEYVLREHRREQVRKAGGQGNSDHHDLERTLDTLAEAIAGARRAVAATFDDAFEHGQTYRQQEIADVTRKDRASLATAAISLRAALLSGDGSAALECLAQVDRHLARINRAVWSMA